MTSAKLHGVNINLHGEASYKDNDAIFAPLKITVPAITQKQLKSLWPKGLEDKSLTEWMTKRISGGVYKDLVVDLNLHGHKKNEEEGSKNKTWGVDAQNINMTFGFAGQDVKALDRFIPIKNISGRGALDAKKDTLRLEIDQADLLNLKIKDGIVELGKVMFVGQDTADMRFPVTGPLSDVFSVISNERIRVDHGFDISKIKGSTAFTLGMKLPTLKKGNFHQAVLILQGDGFSQ